MNFSNKPVPPRFRYAKLGEHGPLGTRSAGIRELDQSEISCKKINPGT